MKKHDDAIEDKKMLHDMLKKALPGKKIAKHLEEDIREQKHAIKKDKGLIKSMRKGYK
jgi:hypothetical protein